MQVKNILITGATSALANSLLKVVAAKNEYRVLAISRSKLIEPEPAGFIEFKKISGIDFTNENHLELLKSHTEEFFSETFDVVHFAGDFWRHKPLICTDFSEICSMVNSHFLSLCGVAKAVTPLMMRYEGGRLVAFSCNSVAYNYPDMSPFTSAKAAIETFVKCYANEKAPYGIAATAIALPTMKTAEILIEKPDGDHENYIKPAELSSFILEHVLTQPAIATGNVMHLVSPSPTFYGQGYFERNPRQEKHNKKIQLTV
jgi:NADP-dependent 3-hydroxy acid dehydrogenase YdfG